jgi:hypothetical protein
MPTDRAPGRLVTLLALLVSPLIVSGCLAVPGAIDAPIGVVLRVSTTPTSVEVEAPGWFTDLSALYLCPRLPPPLPEAAADRVGWTPGGDCHDFGTRPTRDGLVASLPLADLAGPGAAAFASSPEWAILLLELDGDRVSAAVRSLFRAPEGFAAP